MLENLIKTLASSKKIALTGICDQAKPYLISKLIPQVKSNQPVFYFAKDIKTLEQFKQGFNFWSSQKLDSKAYQALEEKNINFDNEQLKQQFIKKQSFLADLYQNKPNFYLFSVEQINSSVPKIKILEKNCQQISLNDTIDPNDLAKNLVAQGYEKSTTAAAKGLFAKKGGLLEIFPINYSQPIRIEFLGNKIDNINFYNPKTGIGIQNHKPLQSITIFPIKTNDSSGKLLDYITYIPKALCILDNPSSLQQNIDPFSQQPYQEFIKQITKHQQIILKSFPDEKTINLDYTSLPDYSQNLKLFKQDLQTKYQNWTIYIYTQEKKQIQKILANLNIKNQKISILTKPNSQQINGFKDNLNKIIVLTDQNLFQPKIAQKNSFDQAFITELKINDFLVHEDHGICLFKGTTKRKIDDLEKEYLILEYAANDKLFLPVEYSEKITKYIGQTHPKINRLHGASWEEAKQKIKAKTQIIAKELLKIYAQREQAAGFKFLPDNLSQQELESSFPYQETLDQIKVIKEVKADMEKLKSQRPMDRLICGDVGFGKTEIAIRAAFKATQSQKQVAILCPTTILAKQHFDNFKQRLQQFNTKVAVISRFQSKLQQQDILAKLALGEIDIIIGTHRLLSSDVKFKDLGLLVLDEEQRFGVKHKETIKKIKANVDCLTLSATPIPRTLNLSLSGLRDISIISTPPIGRQPVTNYIKPYSENTIFQALKKELDRQGQIYFLHNQVQTIQACTQKIARLIKNYSKPVKIAFAHGQMPPNKLEEIMTQFYDRKIDILIASSIIENGLDVPNVNTIIIDNATKFGLANLYQLKGRVGRSTKQAFAYFLYQSQELKAKAQKRLEALLEAKELGSGFQLALRDLEIRGAGNILGKEQSGAVSTIGLNLYCRLLHQAIEEQKTGIQKQPEEVSPTIGLPLSAYLPEKLFPYFEKRLKLYQEIANITDSNELNRYQENLLKNISVNISTISDQLVCVNNLFYILNLKLLAKQIKVKSIKTKKIHQLDGQRYNRFIITFQNKTNYQKAYNLIKQNPNWDIEDQEIKINQPDLKPNWQSSLKQSLQFFI